MKTILNIDAIEDKSIGIEKLDIDLSNYVTNEEFSQKGVIQAVATSEELDDVETNTYVKYVAQTLTEEQKAQVRENIGVEENIDLSGYATKNDLNNKQDVISDLEAIKQGAAKGATSVQQGTLSTVATSGSYNDLTNKPTIPNVVSESTVSGWGFTKNTGTYSKPSTGIPKTDLASAVQTSLAKADTALQTETYKGTVTGVKVNGTTKNPSNGVVDLGTVITSHQDISGKQDTLVSGTNIKTINGNSLLGSGDIVISGGSSSGSGAYSEANHGTSDTTFTLTPNTFHVWDEVTTLDLDFSTETEGVANEYLFQFTSGAEPTALVLPDTIIWQEDITIESNKTYQISILNGLGTVMSWEFVPGIVFPVTLIYGNNGNIGISLYSYLQSTYGEPASGTILNEEIINNYYGTAFNTIEYGTHAGLTGYWLNGYRSYATSWVLFEDGYLQRVMPQEDLGGT